jgi:hypothetical protein
MSNPSATGNSPASSSGGIADWFSNPSNDLTLAGLGIAAYTGLHQPSLPRASQTALDTAGPLLKSAQSTLLSGGTATPSWQQQKAAIDASIDQQIKQQSQAMQQAAVNSGMGNQNSGIVQQQLSEMKSKLETQREQLYFQAQQQNVSTAISELTSENSVLTGIGRMQLEQSLQAQQSAYQTANLVSKLYSLGGKAKTAYDAYGALFPATATAAPAALTAAQLAPIGVSGPALDEAAAAAAAALAPEAPVAAAAPAAAAAAPAAADAAAPAAGGSLAGAVPFAALMAAIYGAGASAEATNDQGNAAMKAWMEGSGVTYQPAAWNTNVGNSTFGTEQAIAGAGKSPGTFIGPDGQPMTEQQALEGLLAYAKAHGIPTGNFHG